MKGKMEKGNTMKKMKNAKRGLLAVATLASTVAASAGSWGSAAEIREGKMLFERNCASCHGAQGSGPGVDWKKKMADGRFPPPPLNGTAHTWHHKPELLARIIREGGKTYGKAFDGWMPSFGEKLSAAQIESVVKYLHSLWPAEIQKRYDKQFQITATSHITHKE